MTIRDDTAVSFERLRDACETLTEAFRTTRDREDPFRGAIGQDDPAGVFIEAIRNLTALCQHIHGDGPWEKLLEERS